MFEGVGSSVAFINLSGVLEWSRNSKSLPKLSL